MGFMRGRSFRLHGIGGDDNGGFGRRCKGSITFSGRDRWIRVGVQGEGCCGLALGGM